MLATLVAALSLASPAIAVPFVPQTDALCGGAAVAMVFRYWGDARADVAQFAPLVERRPGGVVGIANGVLVDAVRGKGWLTDRAGDSLESLRAHLDAKHPIIVLLADRKNLYHYVVVTGADDEAVVIHDPSWGPSRRIGSPEFRRLWAASGYWSLVILPSPAQLQRAAAMAPGKGVVPSHPADPCETLLNRAIDDVRAQGLERADAILARVREQCPSSAGPYRELAGVRFAQRMWPEATTLAREALRRQPDDGYALDVLGASLFMQDDAVGALRAWNRIGKPKLDLVRIEGVRRSRYQTIAEAVGLQPGTMLTPDMFAQAKHRLDELPDRSSARLAMRPEDDGFATVDVVIAERVTRPHGWAGWTAAAIRAGVDREVVAAAPGFTGQGEMWSASWRWWNNRPRVAFGFAAPRVSGLPGVWTFEGSWEVESYRTDAAVPGALGSAGSSADAAIDRLRESRTHGGLTVSDWVTGNVRYSVSAGADAWSSGRRAASIGGSLERRWLSDRVAVAGGGTLWMPVTDGPGFTVVGLRSTIRSSAAPAARDWQIDGTAGIERASADAPMSLWPGAGEGRARVPLARAHPLLSDGTIEVGPRTIFGRTVSYAGADAVRWLDRPLLLRVGIAGFVDVARAARSAADARLVADAAGTAAGLPSAGRSVTTAATQVDVGAGLRLRVPGMGRTLRIDVAHGLRDSANALTVGWSF